MNREELDRCFGRSRGRLEVSTLSNSALTIAMSELDRLKADLLVNGVTGHRHWAPDEKPVRPSKAPEEPGGHQDPQPDPKTPQSGLQSFLEGLGKFMAWADEQGLTPKEFKEDEIKAVLAKAMNEDWYVGASRDVWVEAVKYIRDHLGIEE